MTDKENDMLDDASHDDQEAAATLTDPAVDAPEEDASEEEYTWAEPPVFEVEHKEDCVCEVKVTIPVANIKAMLDEVYEEVNDGVQVPGFRRGKAPRKLLEKRLGKYARSTVVERLADHAAKRLFKEHRLVPVAQADVSGLEDPENVADDKDLVYTICFDTPGKCELGDYKNLELTKPEVEVHDGDVDETVENMRVRFGRYEPVEDGVAEEGDQVIITFTGLVDGEDFDGNRAENYPYILGSKRFGDEIEAAISGAKAGQTVQASLTFPDDHRDEHIAGKTAQYEITLNEIKRRVLPEVDDEFAKRVGEDSLAALRDKIRDRIRSDADERIKEFMHHQALSKLVECSTFTLPKSQVKSFIEREQQAIENRLVEQHVPTEQIESQRAEIEKTAEEQGLLALKTMYAVSALAKAEHITVTDEDFDAYAQSLTQGDAEYYERMKEYLVSEEVRDMTEYRIMESKALDRLVQEAKIVVKPLTDDEEPAEAADAAADEEPDNE